MISTQFEGVGTLLAGIDPTPDEPERTSLIYRMRVAGGASPPHMLQIPGEAIPMLIEMLQQMVKEYPQYTTERAAEGINADPVLIKVKEEDKPRILTPDSPFYTDKKKGN